MAPSFETSWLSIIPNAFKLSSSLNKQSTSQFLVLLWGGQATCCWFMVLMFYLFHAGKGFQHGGDDFLQICYLLLQSINSIIIYYFITNFPFQIIDFFLNFFYLFHNRGAFSRHFEKNLVFQEKIVG